MYNRYIPQPDGSFRRNRIPDAPSNPPHTEKSQQEERRESPEFPPQPEPERRDEASVRNAQPSAHMRQPRPARQPSPPPRQQKQTQQNHGRLDLGIGNFLRQLLPKDFDTEDLIIVLLLLLMSGDCAEDQNSALLTLALYLFM